MVNNKIEFFFRLFNFTSSEILYIWAIEDSLGSNVMLYSNYRKRFYLPVKKIENFKIVHNNEK